MMNEFAGARPSVQVPLAERTLSTEVVGDFSLPDYQPEIKRLLRIGVGVLPPLCSGSGRDTRIEGTLDYYVLYMGHDNALWCAPLSTEYSLAMPVEDSLGELSAGEPFVCLSDVTTESPVGRVTAPRRMSIRCRLQAKVKMYGECLLGAADSEDGDTEMLRGESTVARLFRAMGEMIPLQEDIILPPDLAERRVVCAEGSVLIQEAIPADGVVHMRGEVTVKLTVAEEAGLSPKDAPEFIPDEAASAPASMSSPLQAAMPDILRRKIPFSASVEMEGVTPACTATAAGYCTDLSVEMEDGHIHLELGVIPEVRAQMNERVSYVKDLYSTRRRLITHHAELPTESATRACNGNFTLSDSLPLSEIGMDADARLSDVTAVAIPESVTAGDKGRYVLAGTCRAHLLLLRDGEYTSATMTLPFRYEFDAPMGESPADPCGFDGSVTVLYCRGRSDGERVSLDAELGVSLRTYAPSPLPTMTEVTEDTSPDRSTRRRGEYVICFPAPTDTLWSVAKRYTAPMTALTAANNLPAAPADSAESLEGVGYLIV